MTPHFLSYVNQSLYSRQVTPASPADKIGVQAGDLVTEIGDIPTEGLTLQQAKDIVADFGETILLTLER